MEEERQIYLANKKKPGSVKTESELGGFASFYCDDLNPKKIYNVYGFYSLNNFYEAHKVFPLVHLYQDEIQNSWYIRYNYIKSQKKNIESSPTNIYFFNGKFVDKKEFHLNFYYTDTKLFKKISKTFLKKNILLKDYSIDNLYKFTEVPDHFSFVHLVAFKIHQG